ncbi:MAG: hypothetical protein H6838_06250 [Planctomycetes bacterium]|nr:hypothetical protein [Planctomycetota bacterium]MCB9885074.1 hypothetical protein [Planctomycetota bacterium]
MRTAHVLAAALSCAALIPAQTASNVGLTMDGGTLTVLYGQSCGAFTCQPFVAGPVGVGNAHRVYVYGAIQQPYVLAIGLTNTAPCIPIPGLANSLILLGPVTLQVGLTAAPVLTSACPQARDQYVLQFPVGTPIGVGFQLQALATSATQGPAFTIAIESVTG